MCERSPEVADEQQWRIEWKLIPMYSWGASSVTIVIVNLLRPSDAYIYVRQ